MRWHITRALKIVALLGAAFIGSTLSAPSQGAEDAYATAAADYAAGRVSQAIAGLTKSLPRTDDSQRLKEHLPELTLLVDICVRAEDQKCVSKWAGPTLEATLEVSAGANDFTRTIARRQAAYYFGLLALIADTTEAAKSGLAQGLEREDDAPFDAEKYVDRQLLAARLHLRLDDLVAARLSVERAQATLLSVLNSSEYRWFFATRFADCISLLAALGDVDRAFGLYLISGNFLFQSVPATSLDYVRFRLLEGTLLQQVGNLAGALNAANQARSAMEGIRISAAAKDEWDFAIDLQLALNSLLAGDSASADTAISRLEAAANLGAFRRANAGIPPGVIAVLVLRAMERFNAAQPLAPDHVALLKREVEPATATPVHREYDLYRRFGLLVAIPVTNTAQTRELATQATKLATDYLSFVSERGRFSFEILPRPASVDRLVARTLLAAISLSPDGSSASADLALRLAELITRTSLSFDGEALAILGRARTTEERQLLHNGLRLASRRNKLEQYELKRIILTSSTQSPPKHYLDIEYGRRTVLADFFEKLETTRSYFERVNPVANTDVLLPRLEELQTVLRPHEAVLKIVPIAKDVLLSLCVTDTRSAMSLKTVSLAEADADARLVSMALTLSNAPDESLDRQFPVDSAHRLFLALIESSEECIRDKALVFWLVGREMVPVPVAALLRKVPPRIEGGFDLVEADWLVKSHAFAMLNTTGALIALRRQSALSGQATMQLLGIGDPLLSGLTVDGRQRAEVVLRSSIRRSGGGVADLPPLPETRAELQLTAKAAGSPSTLLLGEAATEGAFRRQPLSQYRYISFATHGLIREEIPGLREAALVLTPRTSSDPFDDGLLTASELADLPLAADFVALSACNTANFDLADFSADIPGLATALAVAGVPATLATMWPVESNTASQIVADVFARLNSQPGLHPASALALAQRAFLQGLPNKAYAHPRFWAPFIVIGDGRNSSVNASTASSGLVSIERIRFQTSHGGEILAATAGPHGDVFASGIGEWNGSKFAAAAMRMSMDGTTIWKQIWYDRGASPVAVPTKGGVIVAGYPNSEGRTATMRGVVQSLDNDGTLLAEIMVEQPGAGVNALSAIGLNDGSTAIAFSVVAENDAGSGSVGSILINRYSDSLQILASKAVPMLKGSQARTAAFGKAGDRIYVAAVDPLYMRAKSEYSDLLQNPRICEARPQTWLYVLDARSLEILHSSWVSNSQLKNFFQGPDEVLFAVGSEVDCEGHSRLMKWRVTESGVEPVYRLESIIDTRGSDGIAIAEGKTLLFGSSLRETDIQRFEEQQRIIRGDEDYAQRVTFHPREISDFVVVVLDADGKEMQRSVFPFGGDVYVVGALETKNGITVFGGVGGESAFIDLHVPYRLRPTASSIAK